MIHITEEKQDGIATDDMYLTADSKEVVGKGDPRAAFLLARKGNPYSLPDGVKAPAQKQQAKQPAKNNVVQFQAPKKDQTVGSLSSIRKSANEYDDDDAA